MKVACPVCNTEVDEQNLNTHLDTVCLARKRQAQWSFLGKKNKPEPVSKPNGSTRTAASSNQKQASIVSAATNGNSNTSSTSNNSNNSGTSSTSNPTNSANSANTSNSSVTGSTVNGSIGSGSKSGSARNERNQVPLAEKMRPRTFAEYVGQEKVIALLKQLTKTTLPSLILWGPSGTGKTTLARAIANESKSRFVELSAPTTSIQDIRRVVEESRADKRLLNRKTILFLDEIHRFNRSQQDSLLQAVERGDFVLIGATTENPSFRLGSALLSRTKVIVLESLSKQELMTVCRRADSESKVSDTILDPIAAASCGDARKALNMLETALSLVESGDLRTDTQPDDEILSILFSHVQNYDMKTENHYDMISAFHKSIRGSSADAALYYLSRMLCGGEDPVYVARRLIRIASEDIGLADDSCLPFAIATLQAVQTLGMPECDVHLAHCAVKFARASKSVEVYKALGMCCTDIRSQPKVANAPVPMHLRNAPTKLMKNVGYGEGYKYNPDFKGPVKQEYMPSELKNRRYLGVFEPTK